MAGNGRIRPDGEDAGRKGFQGVHPGLLLDLHGRADGAGCRRRRRPGGGRQPDRPADVHGHRRLVPGGRVHPERSPPAAPEGVEGVLDRRGLDPEDGRGCGDHPRSRQQPGDRPRPLRRGQGLHRRQLHGVAHAHGPRRAVCRGSGGMDDIDDVSGRFRGRCRQHARAGAADARHRGRRRGPACRTGRGDPRPGPPRHGPPEGQGVPGGKLRRSPGRQPDPLDRPRHGKRADPGRVEGPGGNQQDSGPFGQPHSHRRPVRARRRHALSQPGRDRQADKGRAPGRHRGPDRRPQQLGPGDPQRQGGHPGRADAGQGLRHAGGSHRAHPQAGRRPPVPDGLHRGRPAPVGMSWATRSSSSAWT